MKLIKLECYNCGGTFQVDEDQKICYCTHCGTKCMIDDENEAARIMGKARIKEGEARIKEAEVRMREMDKEDEELHSESDLMFWRSFWPFYIVLMIAFFGFLLIGGYLGIF